MGVPAKVVHEILGHSRIGVTLDTDSHRLPVMQHDAIEKWTEWCRDERKGGERMEGGNGGGLAIVLNGVTMGGGPSDWAARDHALAGHAVAVTPEAGRTFDDDLSMVEQMGFEIIDESEAKRRKENPGLVHIELQDFDARAITTTLRAFDVDSSVDALAIAAFDHGAAPPGISDRRFRFDFIAQTAKRNPVPTAFAYLSQSTSAERPHVLSIPLS